MGKHCHEVAWSMCAVLLATQPLATNAQTCAQSGYSDCTTVSDCTFNTYNCLNNCCVSNGCLTNTDCSGNANIWGDSCTTGTPFGTCTWAAGCVCDKKCEDDYTGKIVAGSIIALVLSLGATIAASIGCCCGVDCGNPLIPKVIGAFSMLVGILMIFVPMMAASNAADGAVDDMCATCSHACSEDDKKAAKDVLTALGFIVAYTIGCGFWACIFGPTAIGIGGCSICQMCGPLSKKDAQQQGMAQPGVVVGAPVQPPQQVQAGKQGSSHWPARA